MSHQNSLQQDLEKGTYSSSGSSNRLANETAGPATKVKSSFRYDQKHIYINDEEIDKDEFLYAFGGNLMVGKYKETTNAKKYANPVPSGLGAFSSTVLTLGLIQMHARSVTHANILIGGLITTSGLVEFIAGILCFIIGNTWATSTFLLFGGFFSSYGFVLMDLGGMAEAYETEHEYAMSIAMFFIPWAIFSFALWITTLRSTWELCALMFCVFMFVLLFVIGQFVTSVNVYKAGGFFCIMSGLLGYYNMYLGIADKSNSYFVPKALFLPHAASPDS